MQDLANDFKLANFEFSKHACMRMCMHLRHAGLGQRLQTCKLRIQQTCVHAHVHASAPCRTWPTTSNLQTSNSANMRACACACICAMQDLANDFKLANFEFSKHACMRMCMHLRHAGLGQRLQTCKLRIQQTCV